VAGFPSLVNNGTSLVGIFNWYSQCLNLESPGNYVNNGRVNMQIWLSVRIALHLFNPPS